MDTISNQQLTMPILYVYVRVYPVSPSTANLGEDIPSPVQANLSPIQQRAEYTYMYCCARPAYMCCKIVRGYSATHLISVCEWEKLTANCRPHQNT